MIEVNRILRGHAFLPPADVLSKIPPCGGQDLANASDHMIWAHYVAPVGDWWLAELDRIQDEYIGFGYVRLGLDPACAEWGSFSLREMEELRIGPYVAVERDLTWTPKPSWQVDTERI
jgi:hypothetical protein